MITEANAVPPGDDTSERALIVRAQQGDTQAFAALYRHYHPFVLSYVLQRVGRDRQLAEDLTADVFLRALSKISLFSWTGKPLRTWLCTIARHRIADHYKVCSTSRTTAVAEITDVADTADISALAAEDSVMATLTEQALRVAVAQLCENQRLVLVCRFFLGMSLKETAEFAGTTVGGVKARTLRAMTILRHQFAEAGEAA
ncbi:RNA polymerase sigma factor [Streptomyces sp. NBC_00670]|uniref:RNA polymerase sigma factor n=1 Tax=Streptomyces sp. NBC_00670 TaxID=2975804 RepID=UPI002E33F68E|nr:RNA polymerase sigma factor [Streptomyces sp. NBC_00670]